jgi:flagellar hook-associated protein 3 FlgL
MSVKSEIIDADYGETMIEFQQLSLAYQAMLNSISQINSMSLLNYM